MGRPIATEKDMKTWCFIIRKDRKDGEELARGHINAKNKHDAFMALVDAHGIGNYITVWK